MHLMRILLLLLVAAGLPAPAHAVADVKATPSRTAKKPTAAVQARKPAAKAAAPAAPSVVAATREGQAGYVHYWLITAPDGAEEIQIGIELADQRIAWSFPGLGVHLAPFIADGEVDAGGRAFKVRHLYGLRPFAQEQALRRLRGNLQRRVMPLVQQRTPYCELNGVTPGLCMSCMGFVSQVLFPGKTPEYADFPRNFPRIAGEDYHTTEDLLLYLTGLHAPLPDAARRQRIAALGGPPALQEELDRLALQLAGNAPVVADAGTAVTPKGKVRSAPKSATRRPPKSG